MVWEMVMENKISVYDLEKYGKMKVWSYQRDDFSTQAMMKVRNRKRWRGIIVS